MAAYTFDDIALNTPELMHRAVINALREHSDFLNLLDWRFWGTGRYVQYTRMITEPDAQVYDDDDTINETASTRKEFQAYLKRYGIQFAIENFQSGTMQDAEMNGILDAARGLGKDIRTDFLTAESMAETIGATAGTAGVDDIIPCPHMPAGLGYLDFDDTADTIRFKAPGDADYGTAVDCSLNLSSAHDYLYSENKNYWVRITFDFSDSDGSGDWTTTNAATGVTFATTKKVDGLITQVEPSQRVYGTLSATTPTANGDTVDLDQLDWLIRNCYGPNPVILTPGIMVDAYRQKIGTLGGTTPDHFAGRSLSGAVVPYRNSLIVPEDNITRTETVGTTTNCTSAICVSMGGDGLHAYFGNPGGPTTSLRDDSTGPGNVPVPVYVRRLAEKIDKDQMSTRMTMFATMVLGNPQYISEIHGLKV